MLSNDFETKHNEKLNQLKEDIKDCDKSLKDLDYEFEKIDIVENIVELIKLYITPYILLTSNAINFIDKLDDKIENYKNGMIKILNGKYHTVLDVCDTSREQLSLYKKLFKSYKNVLSLTINEFEMCRTDEMLINSYEELDKHELTKNIDELAQTLIEFEETHHAIAEDLGWI